MAAGTVGYTDTRGNKDYTSMIASQIGNRLKQASNMASEERAYASKQAEAGGTSLEEAGIGKGYFFGRALGSRFGGDRIARAKGRMGMGGAVTNPATNYKQRFRGGFDYNVTNQAITDVAPLSNALVTGLRGVEEGLGDVAGAIQRQGTILNQLSQSQADMAKATMFNGYLFAMFQSQQKQRKGRESLRREERSIEGGRSRGIRGGNNRGMINVTPKDTRGAGNIARSSTAGALGSFGTSQLLGQKTVTKQAISKGKDVVKAISTPGKLAQSAGKGFKGMLTAAGKLITGDVVDEKMIGKIAEIVPQTMPGIKITSSQAAMFPQIEDFFKAGNMFGANLPASTDAGIANRLAQMQQAMDPKSAKLLDALMFDDVIDGAVGQKEALEVFEFIKKGGMTDGVEMSTEAALDLVTKGMGSSEAKEKLLKGVLKGADAPITKGLSKTAAVSASKAAAKQAGKTTAKAGLASLGKKIPLIAGLVGVGFGIQRALQGDFLGAGLEITSGLLGATGVGTGLSFGIDGFLLARDLGMMPGMRTGGNVRGLGANTIISAGGMPLFRMNEAKKDAESLSITKNLPDNKQHISQGIGLVEGFKKKSSDFFKLIGKGVFSGIGDAASGGLFENIGSGISNIVESLKDTFGNFKDSFKETFNNLKEKLGNIFNNLKEKFGEKFSNFKDSLVNKYNNFKDSVGNKINNVKQWWNKDSSDGSMIDNARFGVKKFLNRTFFGKDDAKNMKEYNPKEGVMYGSLPSNYKEEEAKYFQTGMYTPNVENSGINVVPGNMTGHTVITNNYYGGGSGGGETETGEGNPSMSDLGFEGLVTNYALATK